MSALTPVAIWTTVVASHLPLVLAVIGIIVIWQARPVTHEARRPLTGARIILLFAAVMWLVIYAELYAPAVVPVLDYGAFSLSLAGLVVVPAAGLYALATRRALRVDAARGWLLTTTWITALLALAPGAYIVWFYGSIMVAGPEG